MQKNLSQIFREHLNISEEDLKEAQRIKAEKGGNFAQILVTKKLVTERQLLEALSIQYDIPFWPELPLEKYKTDFTDHVPIQFLKRYVMVPLISETQSSDFEEKLDDLKALKAELNAAKKLVKKCSGCTNAPSSHDCPDCPVNKNLKKIEVLNLVWE